MKRESRSADSADGFSFLKKNEELIDIADGITRTSEGDGAISHVVDYMVPDGVHLLFVAGSLFRDIRAERFALVVSGSVKTLI